MTDATHFTISLSNAFKRLGTQNGLAVPTPNAQDPANNMLHELLVAKSLASMATKRYDNAKKAVIDQINEDALKALSATATKHKMKLSEQLLESTDYTLTVSCASPVVRVDVAKLINQLIIAGVKGNIVTAAVEKATGYNAPATSYDVVLKDQS